MQMELLFDSDGLAPLGTVGLGESLDAPWRMKTPNRVRDIIEATDALKTLHLVGHIREDDHILKTDGDISISPDTLRANLLSGLNTVILSGCSAATKEFQSNL